MPKSTKQTHESHPSTEPERTLHLGWFALVVLVGVVAFLVWFIVNGVDEA